MKKKEIEFPLKDMIYTKIPNKIMPDCWGKVKIYYIGRYGIVWFRNAENEPVSAQGGCTLNEFYKCYKIL